MFLATQQKSAVLYAQEEGARKDWSTMLRRRSEREESAREWAKKKKKKLELSLVSLETFFSLSFHFPLSLSLSLLFLSEN